MKPTSSRLARFIPREEIDGFAAWPFAAVTGGEEPPPAEEPEQAEAAERWDAEQVEAVRQQALAEGYARGHADGARETRETLEAEIRRVVEETAAQMAGLLQQVRTQLRRSEHAMARELLALACDVARQVVRQELRQPVQHLQAVVAEAVAQLLDDGQPARVRLHPEDVARLQEGFAASPDGRDVTLVADPSLARGDCIVESASVTVDATVATRWARAIGNLGLDAPWNPEDGDV
jgi:flagellar assembly protein FliH